MFFQLKTSLSKKKQILNEKKTFYDQKLFFRSKKSNGKKSNGKNRTKKSNEKNVFQQQKKAHKNTH